MPKISVIIPAYNRAEYLPRAVKSVLDQTFQDFEIIIVDDGSTDNTKEVAEKLKKEDSRIKYFWQKNSGGPPAPKNKGIRNSCGEYVACLDSDDEWMKDKLKKQLTLFEKSDNSKLGFVGCNILMIDVLNNKTVEYKIPRHKDVFKNSLISCYIWSCSNVMIKRSVLDDVGFFDEGVRFADDKELWIRISKKYDFDFVDEFLFKYYVHGQNIVKTTGLAGHAADHEHILKKYEEDYKKYPKMYSDQLRHLGSQLFRLKETKKGRYYFKKSLKYNKFNLKSYLYYILSFLGVKTFSKVHDATVAYRGSRIQKSMAKWFIID